MLLALEQFFWRGAEAEEQVEVDDDREEVEELLSSFPSIIILRFFSFRSSFLKDNMKMVLR